MKQICQQIYTLDTLNLGPSGTFWIPWTFGYLLDTLKYLVSFGCHGPLGTFWIPWTFRFLLVTLNL